MPFRDYVPATDPEYARLSASGGGGSRSGFRDYIAGEEIDAALGVAAAQEQEADKPAETDLPCPHCEKTFKAPQGLAAHIRMKHGVPVVTEEEPDLEDEEGDKPTENDPASEPEVRDVTAADTGSGAGA